MNLLRGKCRSRKWSRMTAFSPIPSFSMPAIWYSIFISRRSLDFRPAVDKANRKVSCQCQFAQFVITVCNVCIVNVYCADTSHITNMLRCFGQRCRMLSFFCLHSLCICIFNFKAFYKLLLSFVIHMNAYVVRILSRYLAFLQWLKPFKVVHLFTKKAWTCKVVLSGTPE